MRITLLLSSLILAAFAEWSVAPLFAPYFLPPLLAATVLFWFFRMPLASRLLLGFSTGFFMDSISPMPFGTYLTAFFLTALLVEVVGIFLLHSESLLIRAASWMVLVVAFMISSPVIGWGIQSLLN